MLIFCFKQKTAYEMRISDWSSDVCSSDLCPILHRQSLTDGPLRQRHAVAMTYPRNHLVPSGPPHLQKPGKSPGHPRFRTKSRTDNAKPGTKPGTGTPEAPDTRSPATPRPPTIDRKRQRLHSSH